MYLITDTYIIYVSVGFPHLYVKVARIDRLIKYLRPIIP